MDRLFRDGLDRDGFAIIPGVLEQSAISILVGFVREFADESGIAL